MKIFIHFNDLLFTTERPVKACVCVRGVVLSETFASWPKYFGGAEVFMIVWFLFVAFFYVVVENTKMYFWGFISILAGENTEPLISIITASSTTCWIPRWVEGYLWNVFCSCYFYPIRPVSRTHTRTHLLRTPFSSQQLALSHWNNQPSLI